MSSPVLTFDLETLVSSRLLIQGSSGAGKSFLIRYLLEQTHGRIQQFVFDPEGEFSTLRERFDYVVASAGGDGDVPAHPDTADLLCRQLVELEASAIFDIYELDPEERQEFVGRFLHRLVNMPKETWRSALVVVDEAHEYAPEQGRPPSRRPMELIVSKGRKRGLCAVYATQRLSKLSKNASDLQNILVGYTGLDVDVRRAGDMLGFDKAQARELKALRHEFFAFGPALSREVTRVRSGALQTHHPKPGEIRAPTPPPRGELAKLVATLAEIPDRVAEEEEAIEAVRAQVRRLEAELRTARAAGITEEEAEARAAARAAAAVRALRTEVRPHVEALHHALANGQEYSRNIPGEDLHTPAPAAPARRPAAAPAASRPAPKRSGRTSSADASLSKGERIILTAVAQHDAGVTREQLSVLTAYKRSSRDTYLQKLRSGSLVEEHGGVIQATSAGLDALGDDFEPLPTGDALQEYWLDKLSGGEREILRMVCAAYPRAIDRDEISTETGHKRSSRDTYLQRLGARKLVSFPDRGVVIASEELFG